MVRFFGCVSYLYAFIQQIIVAANKGRKVWYMADGGNGLMSSDHTVS